MVRDKTKMILYKKKTRFPLTLFLLAQIVSENSQHVW
ncbi:hypothetical protein CsSME_00034546 [Camellia sinensis var. sinensis]